RHYCRRWRLHGFGGVTNRTPVRLKLLQSERAIDGKAVCAPLSALVELTARAIGSRPGLPAQRVGDIGEKVLGDAAGGSQHLEVLGKLKRQPLVAGTKLLDGVGSIVAEPLCLSLHRADQSHIVLGERRLFSAERAGF